MRLFAVTGSDQFVEYEPHDFSAENPEQVIEAWLENNPQCILEDGGLLLIGRQVTTNLGTTIDLLGLDREGNVAVVELKRGQTPRDTLAQALEYASFAATLGYEQLQSIAQGYTGDEGVSLAERHREFFGLSEGEAVSFNKDQRIVLVGSAIAPAIRQMATYLGRKGLRVTCLEFSYFRTAAGERLLSTDVVAGGERRIAVPTPGKTDERQFLAQCDEAGRALFIPMLALAKERGYPIHWGTRGFSLNADLDGRHVAVCFGYPKAERGNINPQSLWSAFSEIRKVAGTSELIAAYRDKLLATGLFVPARSEVKYLIERTPSPEQVDTVLGLIRGMAEEAACCAAPETGRFPGQVQ
ncbi:MAG: hypothetical protein FJZ90_17690 [Chloroflexi bacterium]|nr:hypothetical protein [Chloroflexota bacterium]